MDESRYNDYEYDDYEDYRRRRVTSIGLSPGQLALLIGVNAVISLIISVVVVLLASRPGAPADIATLQSELKLTPGATAELAAGSSPVQTPTLVNLNSTASADSQATTYVVQPGDTLSAIAEKLAIPMADLMAANGLSNQDFIQVGQELAIPVGGAATATPTFTPAPILTETPLPFDPPTPLPAGADVPPEPAATVGPSPTATPTPVPSPTLLAVTPPILPTSTQPSFAEINVVVSEVISGGDLAQETLVILNQGAGVSLKDWKLEGSSLGVVTFPDIFLFSGGSIRIHTAAGENTASDVYLNQGEAAWSPGTTIILSNASNAEISRFKVPGGASSP